MREHFRNRLAVPLLVLFTFVLLAVGRTAHAQTGTFYFTAQGNTTPINNIVTTGPGQIINLSVYFQVTPGVSGFAPNDVNAFVGFDTTTTEGPTASPTDLMLVLNGDASSAVSNVNAAFTQFFGGQLGGGQSVSTGPRPFGDDLFFGTPAGTAFTSTTATHLFDISIKNMNLSSGSATVSLFNGGTGTDFTTYLSDGPTYVRPTTDNLTITAAPEPAQTATLGLVALGLGGLMLRARPKAKN